MLNQVRSKSSPGLAGLIIGAILCLASAPLFAAEVVSKKDGVKIFADASNKSEVVHTLKKGQGLASLERKGMYWEVKLKDGRSGFVSVLQVQHKAEVGGDLAAAVKTAVKGGRSMDMASESRARSAVMGVRGLKQDENIANAGSVRPNLRAVYSMEDRSVDGKSIDSLGSQVFKEISKKAKEN